MIEISTIEREMLSYLDSNNITTNDALKFIKELNWNTGQKILKDYSEKLFQYKLQNSIENKDLEKTISLLNSNESNVNIDLNWTIEFAIDNVEILKVLLKDERIDPAYDNNYNIIFASELGLEDTVELFLKDKRIDPSAQGNKSMQKAVGYNRPEVVKLLLNDSRVSPNISGYQPISVACRYGYLDVVKLLLNDDRVDPSVGDDCPLYVSAKYDDIDVMKLLLNDKRVDPTTRNNYAVKKAFQRNNVEMLNLLWKNKKVKDSLFEENSELYNKIDLICKVKEF